MEWDLGVAGTGVLALLAIGFGVVALVRAEYTARRTNLNAANMNGVCAGRMKPRSFGIVPFPGVTYDCGGWETVAVWSTKMGADKVAGDINTPTFADPVAEADLIAYDAYVDPGSHIVMWHRWLNGGLDIIESTASSNLDRTVKRWVDDSHINGYDPVRYVNAC